MANNFDLVLKEARRMLEENPNLKRYQALDEAKATIKKELSSGNLKSSGVKN